MMAATPIRILILGTGSMARAHAGAFAEIDGVEVVAGVDTDPVRLSMFTDAHGIRSGFASLKAAIAWGDFDAAANATPDAVHHKTTLALLAAGKHVLCEKPLATNFADAAEMAAAAGKAGVVNMVNLTYRNVAALAQARQLVADGAIGAVRHFDASYLQSWLTQPAWGHWDSDPQWLWRLSKAHGSNGTLGDIGIHIVDFATHIAGSNVADVSARLKCFDKASGGRIGDYVLDANDSVVMHVGLENGAIGVIHATRFASGHINDLRLQIFGTKGGLDVQFSNGQGRLRASLGDDLATGQWQEVEAPEVATNYQNFIAAIKTGTAGKPDFARGAALQEVLDLAARSDGEQGQTLSL